MNTRQIYIMSYLDSKGIKHSHDGFRYLTEAIERCMDARSMLFRIRELYHAVAVANGTTDTKVERSIRYSILGTGISNKEFISTAVDHISWTMLVNNFGPQSISSMA